MSKNKRKQTSSVEADPQSLFQQFSPTLYFEKPKPSSRDGWFIIAEQVVPAARMTFWETIVIHKFTFDYCMRLLLNKSPQIIEALDVGTSICYSSY